ncbi:outer membrane protein assembly factor BamB [Parashewanella spongiae]|uniref:Outer membrane protein assembly factor BamB n=1 Tax=Parashewanella spongiae TaxID=342950 RepID=A0A3A6TEP7_9GAMM|nr:outer membrane protein assembly factor BamB [Parashewanella spongiae]MCL1078927.1 outer membrane protein assembly factor BamB [Parashewanella spongiae]RJY11537.1 outer membrane protein assembly factor BamB [Parashewanella spongiae]
MTFWCKNLLVAGLSIAALSACSSSDVEEVKISELPEIEATVAPVISWSTVVGSGVGDYYSRLRPAVKYDKLFAGDRNGQLVAFDQKTHQQLWKQDLNDIIHEAGIKKNFLLAAGVSVSRNKVFAGGEAGVLVALDAETGALAWHVETDGELLSTPTIGEDVVVVATSSGAIEAYDVDSGEQRWISQSQLPPLTLRGTGAASYESGGFFLGTADGKVQVIVQKNGQVAWESAVYTPKGGNEFSRLADVDMKPLLSGENLYAVSYNGNLVSMEARTGRVVWSRKYSSFHELAEAGLSLFLVDDSSRIYSVDKRNGLELWSNSELENRTLTSPAVFEQYLIVGDFEGYLHFIDRISGEITGRVQVDSDGLYVQPVVVDNKVYVQGRSGKLAEVTLP